MQSYVLTVDGLPRLNEAVEVKFIMPANQTGPVRVQISLPKEVTNGSVMFPALYNQKPETEIETLDIMTQVITNEGRNTVSPSATSLTAAKPTNYNGMLRRTTAPTNSTIPMMGVETATQEIPMNDVNSPGFLEYRRRVYDELNREYGEENLDKEEVEEEVSQFWSELGVEDRKEWEQYSLSL